MFFAKITKGLKLFFNTSISVFALILLGITIPQVSAGTNCGPINTYWAIGPDANTAYIDVCAVGLGTDVIKRDFLITGISGSGVENGSAIYWGGNGCLRVTTKNCASAITGNCAYVGIKTLPKDGQNNGGFWASPVANIRYPDGSSTNVVMGGAGYNYSECNPAPSCNLSVNKNTLTLGETITSTWSSSANTTSAQGSVYVNNALVYGPNNQPALNSSATMTPDRLGTTKYELVVRNASGVTSVCSATFNVVAPTPAPTCNLSVNKATLTLGETITSTWSSSNAVSAQGSVYVNNALVYGPTDQPALNSSATMTPDRVGTTKYELVVKNASGTTGLCSATFNVVAPTPTAPTCNLSVNKATLTLGETITSTWSSSNAVSAQGSVYVNNSLVYGPTDQPALNSSATMTPDRVGMTKYELVVKNASGTTGVCSATFNVVETTLTHGLCGTSDEAYFNSAPTTNLCAAGTPSIVAGIGPWTWLCNGINGGRLDSCIAYKTTTPTPAPTCTISFNQNIVNPGAFVNATWSTTNATSATATYTVNGVTSAPVNKTVTNTSVVETVGPHNATTRYDLNVTGPGGTSTCTATVTVVDAPPATPACGTANGGTFANSPATNANVTLCSAGTPSAVSGGGSWNWTCTNSTTVNCSANIPVVQNPSCNILANGLANATINTGESVNLSWNSFNASSASLNQGIGTVSISGNQNVTPANTITYTLTVVGNGLSNTCSTTVTVNPIAPTYDLAIGIHVDDTAVAPNLNTNSANPVYTNLTYDVTYRNIGNSTMTNVVVTVNYDQTRVQILTAPGATNNGDILTWNIATLNAGDVGTFTYEARLLDTTVSGQSLSDLAHIESTTPGMQLANEVNQANNDASVTVNVNETNRSSMSKRVTNLNTGITSTAVHAVEGDVLEYILSYTAGDTAVLDQMIIDNDPNNPNNTDLNFTSIFMYANLVDSGLGAFHQSGVNPDGTPIYDRATFGPFDIPAYQTQEVRFRVQIKANITNIGGDYTLRNAYGNDVTVVTLPNLNFNKFVSVDGGAETQNDSAVPGSVLVYRLSVTNTGGSSMNGFVFEDDITDILEYTSMINANGGIISTNANNEQIIAWAPETIPAGGTVDHTFTVRVNDPLIAGGDYTLRNVYGNAVTVVTIPDVIISKSVLNTNTGISGIDVTADENHILTYTLSATSTLGFTGYIFEDNIADVNEYANITNISDAGTLQGGGTLVRWNTPVNIPAGGTVTRTFNAEIDASANWPSGLGFDRVMTNVFGNTVNVRLPGSINQTDLHIEKTVSGVNATTPPSGGAGTVVNYTITYRNEGNLNATTTRIIDNYDEAHLTNITNVVMPAGVTVVDDGSQMTFTIGNLAIGASGTITYQATINNNSPHGQDIINTADILSAEVDGDMTDNQASALVRVASLQMGITKTSDLATVTNNQTVTYTITVTNNEATPQTVTIIDTFALNGRIINGSNGGSMTMNAGSQNVVFGGTGTFVGDITTPAGVTLNNIQSNRSVTITYTAVSSNAGIPANTSSNVPNVATLYFQGSATYSATRTVVISGPGSGGCTVNCGSGSGSGGGGSSGGIYETTDPRIQKLISINGGSFIDANLPANALVIAKNKNNLVTYQVIVSNPSQMTLKEVKIADVFSGQNSRIKQFAVRNIRGAEYADGVFTIAEIGKKSQASFTYQATLNTNSALANSSAYNQVTITDYKRSGRLQGTKRVGQMDRAYVILKQEEVDRLLYKYSNKSAINHGDEIEYTIIVKNVYDYDLRNVVVTDDYDEAHLEIVSAPGTNNGTTLEFRRTILRPGESATFRYKARGINHSKEALQANNTVKIFSDSVDLSNETAQRTITIYPKGVRLAQTGTGTIVLLMVALAGGLLMTRRKKIV